MWGFRDFRYYVAKLSDTKLRKSNQKTYFMINPLASNGIWTTHVGNWDVWVNYPQRNFWTVADINTKYLAPDVWILFSIHLSHWDHVTYASFMISDTTQPRLSCILVIISSMHSTSNVASVTANCKNKWKQFYLTLQVDVAHWQSRPYVHGLV